MSNPDEGGCWNMDRIARIGAAVLGAVLLASATACGGSGKPTTASVPGVTATEIVVGTHQPLTGPAAAGYSKISAATKAYFDYVNANGGVFGRKITYKIMDDGYNPANTQQVVRQLVLQDKVFAILNGLGTPTHTGVLDFLNTNKVPDLFVASGSLSWNQPAKYPYTFGYNPNYTIEGKIIADYVKANFAGQKVCVFGQHDDFGADGLKGVQQVLGAGGVAHSETYDVTNTNVAPAIGALKQAGCQVTVSFSVPGFTAPGLAPFRYSKTDHSGYRGLQMGKVQGGKQLLFGPVYTTDDAGGPVEQSSTAQPVPPENGIPA